MSDAAWKDILKGVQECMYLTEKRDVLITKIEKLWKHDGNNAVNGHVLSSLSVRTVFDMYLRLQRFPEDSEVIMSAINIPDMCYIVRHHKLKIVSLDINIDDATPKWELLPSLITPRTKVVIATHIYGKWFDVNPLLDVTEKLGIHVLEDCAEGYLLRLPYTNI